jgi:hypothetical protein
MHNAKIAAPIALAKNPEPLPGRPLLIFFISPLRWRF